MLGQLTPTPMLAVKDLARARRFYEGTLGLERAEESMEGILTYRPGGTALVVYTSQYAGTNKATALTWTLGDGLERTVDELRRKGVEFEHYEMPDTVRRGDVHVSGEIRNAWFKDPDGNIHALSNL